LSVVEDSSDSESIHSLKNQLNGVASLFVCILPKLLFGFYAFSMNFLLSKTKNS